MLKKRILDYRVQLAFKMKLNQPMIKFFRKIRKGLLTENKFSKYLLYAAGEIILVIIGILIALAISDWNGDRLEKKSEIRALAELKKGILLDLNLIELEQKSINKALASIAQLQIEIKNKERSYDKELDTLFGPVYGIRTLRLNKAFYEDLKSSGLGLIKDADLRLKIVQLFEYNYALLSQIFDIETFINQVTRPYYLSNFHHISFKMSATPNNFKTIWVDPYFHNIIDYRKINLEANQKIAYQETIDAINDVVAAINTYLKK